MWCCLLLFLVVGEEGAGGPEFKGAFCLSVAKKIDVSQPRKTLSGGEFIRVSGSRKKIDKNVG